MPADIFVDTTPMRGGKTTRALSNAQAQNEDVLFISPIIGDPFDDQSLLTKFSKLIPNGNAWISRKMMCEPTQRTKKNACSNCPQNKSAINDTDHESWLPNNWRDATKTATIEECPWVVGKHFTYKTRKSTMLSFQRFQHLGATSDHELVEHVEQIVANRHVIIDEFHEWETLLTLSSEISWITNILGNPPRKRFNFLGKARALLGPDLVDSFNLRMSNWLRCESKAAIALEGAKLSLREHREFRHSLWNHNLDGSSIPALRQEITTLSTEITSAIANLSPAAQAELARLHTDLVTLVSILAKTGLGQPIFKAEAQSNQRVPAQGKQITVKWKIKFCRMDVKIEVVDSGTKVIPRHIILDTIIKHAAKLTLLSATPPPWHEVEAILHSPFDHLTPEPGAPAVEIMVERSSRNQFAVTHNHHRKAKAGDSLSKLIIPAAAKYNGMVFARGIKEFELLLEASLPEHHASYARGPNSVGVQAPHDFVALVGVPLIPATHNPFAFIDPIGVGWGSTSSEESIPSRSRQKNNWSTISQVFQLSARTTINPLNLQGPGSPGKCVIFGAYENWLTNVISEDFQKTWLRSTKSEPPKIFLLPSTRSELKYRQSCVRAFLDGMPFSRAKPTPIEIEAKTSRPPKITPRHVGLFYKILELQTTGELNNPFSPNQIPKDSRCNLKNEKHATFLKQLAQNWNQIFDGDPMLTTSKNPENGRTLYQVSAACHEFKSLKS